MCHLAILVSLLKSFVKADFPSFFSGRGEFFFFGGGGVILCCPKALLYFLVLFLPPDRFLSCSGSRIFS